MLDSLSFPYEVVCKHCGEPIRFRCAELQRITGDPASPPMHFVPLVVGCPLCKRASIYHQFERPYLHPPLPLACQTTLWCGTHGCGLYLPAIVPTGEAAYKEAIAEWIYLEDVHCANDHLFDPQEKSGAMAE